MFRTFSWSGRVGAAKRLLKTFGQPRKQMFNENRSCNVNLARHAAMLHKSVCWADNKFVTETPMKAVKSRSAAIAWNRKYTSLIRKIYTNSIMDIQFYSENFIFYFSEQSCKCKRVPVNYSTTPWRPNQTFPTRLRWRSNKSVEESSEMEIELISYSYIVFVYGSGFYFQLNT